MTTLTSLLDHLYEGDVVDTADLARVSDANPRSVARWKAEAATPRREAVERLLELRAVVDLARRVMRDDAARFWMRSPNIDSKTNEITGFAPLLDRIDITGAVITADALCRCRHNASAVIRTSVRSRSSSSAVNAQISLPVADRGSQLGRGGAGVREQRLHNRTGTASPMLSPTLRATSETERVPASIYHVAAGSSGPSAAVDVAAAAAVPRPLLRPHAAGAGPLCGSPAGAARFLLSSPRSASCWSDDGYQGSGGGTPCFMATALTT